MIAAQEKFSSQSTNFSFPSLKAIHLSDSQQENLKKKPKVQFLFSSLVLLAEKE